ncbi:hypothetical protein [Pantoea latae]|uniref:hypothetical protein n=1 Tax=Pantoea latae TaxID=1964541 RepID=UPI001301A312|nr:hypothetical protein [Pantoea latae]
MKKIYVTHEVKGDISRTVVKACSMRAELLKIGRLSKLTVIGRGNVRMLKEVTRKLAKV